MYNLEQDLKELGYEIIWKQILSYPPKGNITIIGAIHAPTEISKMWTACIKFSGQGTEFGAGAACGFLCNIAKNNKQSAIEEISKPYFRASLSPAKVC